jgi:hypothetical protein
MRSEPNRRDQRQSSTAMVAVPKQPEGVSMFRSRASRALLVPALLVPLAAATLAFAGVSSAASPAKASYPVKCKTLTGTVGTTGTISGCNGNTGGSGSFPTVPSSSATVTWTNGDTTTASFNYASVSSSTQTCPSADSEYKITGTVSADTTGSIPVGSGLKGYVCLTSSGSLSLAPKAKGSTTLKKFKI